MTEPTASTGSAWTRFWNAGTWWKALLLVLVYWGVYQLLGLASSTVFSGSIDQDNVLAAPLSVFFGVALPILVSGLLLLLFARSVGWIGELVGPQEQRGRAWMWVAVALVLVPNVMRLTGTNWSAWSVALVLSILFLGLCVGFTEELATRGLVVTMLRRGGHGERTVLLLSSLYFALLHAGNIFGGQAPALVALTVLYTFGFGTLMYLSLRLTGSLIWPVLLHASTDPTTILATGGIDAHADTVGHPDALIQLAGVFNFVYIAFALLVIVLVKNRTTSRPPTAR